MDSTKTIQRIRVLLALFVTALVLSGLTAFPLAWETRLLAQWFGEGTPVAGMFPALAWWLSHVHEGLAAERHETLRRVATPERVQSSLRDERWMSTSHTVG